MEDTKDNGIIEKTEEVLEHIDPTKYKVVKKLTEKQVAARKANGERLKKIIEMKKVEKEKIIKEQETKLVAELKEKWKKEYAEEKKVEGKKNSVAVPKSMIEKKKMSGRVKFSAKKKAVESDDDESSATEDDHIPSDTEGETTDTRVIKKKLAKVKQIEQVVSKQAVNPYLSLLEKWYK